MNFNIPSIYKSIEFIIKMRIAENGTKLSAAGGSG